MAEVGVKNCRSQRVEVWSNLLLHGFHTGKGAINRPADSFPTTMFNFWEDSIAEMKVFLAWERNAGRLFGGKGIPAVLIVSIKRDKGHYLVV